MKNILLLSFLLITICSSAQIVKTVEVKEPGTLYSLLEPEINNISKLIISGELNKEDFLVMNNMTKKGILKNIDIYECIVNYVDNYSSYQEIPRKAFENCNNLENIILPKECAVISTDAFYNCTSLNDIEFPESLYRIEADAFENCSGLKKIIFPAGLTELYSGTFFNCSNLEEIIFSYNPSLDKTLRISQHCFQRCTNLRKIVFPSNFQIGYFTFYECPLKEIVCESMEPPIIDSKSFDDDTKNNCNVFVPKGAYNNYAWKSQNWSDFKNISEKDVTTINKKIADSDLIVYGQKEALILKSLKPGKAFIYNVKGQLIQNIEYQCGTNYIMVNEGIYIIKTSEQTFKIYVR